MKTAAAGLMRINVEGTRALLEAAYQQGVRRVVHTSSIAVLAPRPDHPLTDETMRRDAEREPDAYYRSKILADREVDAALERHPDLHASLVLPGFIQGGAAVGLEDGRPRRAAAPRPRLRAFPLERNFPPYNPWRPEVGEGEGATPRPRRRDRSVSRRNEVFRGERL